jgi:hypothetical protein
MALDRVKGFYRSCLLQIIVVGLVAFCEPGIWTALNNLGAGGNASVSQFFIVSCESRGMADSLYSLCSTTPPMH